jgi:hypothetical protein
VLQQPRRVLRPTEIYHMLLKEYDTSQSESQNPKSPEHTRYTLYSIGQGI